MIKQSRYRPGVAQRVPGSSDKAVPLQAWSGQEGTRKLRFPDYVTTAQDGCKVPATFTTQEILLVLISVRG
jgi:hypothetical protein